MKIKGVNFAIIMFAAVSAVSAQWVKQPVDTAASFRGLSIVNEKTVWASGTGGTVIRTVDGGKTWNVMTVAGAEKLDFRDIEAFDAKTAYVLSIGNGDASRIYKTVDGGANWKLQFTNSDQNAFFDAIACWDRNNCMAMSDPVKNKYVLFGTTDGEKWTEVATDKMAYAKDGEAAFAASGTCLITQGKNSVYLVSGGSDARVFRSHNRGLTWFVADTPMAKGTPGSGIFSIAMYGEKIGVIVGGNYEKPDEAQGSLAFTRDGGRSWTSGSGLTGYRSAVAHVDSKTIVAVGPKGTDITRDSGSTWNKFGSENLNAVAAKRRTVWAVGPAGAVYRMSTNKSGK
jgi:photosystem II stability/assembly factor-like uncharacterized protein